MKHIKETIKTFLGYIGWILAGALILFILVDYKAHSDLAEIYASLDQGTASASDMKKLEFLSSYIKATEDISIMGKINGTWTDTQPGDTPVVEDPGDGSGLNGEDDSIVQVGSTDSYTPEGWKEALAKVNHPYWKIDTGGYRLETINGTTYLTEYQGAGFWGSVKDSEGTSSVDGKGCWLFAMSNAANALNGTTYSLKEAMMGRNPQDNIIWAGNVWKSTLPKRIIGQGTYNDAAGMAAMGCTISQIENNVGTVEHLHEILKTNGFDNCVYIAYFHTPLTSSGGCHWMAIVGVDDSNIYVLNNKDRGSKIPITGQSLHPNCKARVKNPVTTLFRVSKK